MRSTVTFLALSLLATLAFPQTRQWTSRFQGVEFGCYALTMDSSLVTRLELLVNDSMDLHDDLMKALETSLQSPFFAISGGMFEAGPVRPKGLFVDSGKVVSSIDTGTGSGNFYLQPNGVFEIDLVGQAKIHTTQDHMHEACTPLFAIQLGPMLIVNGSINSIFNPTSKNLLPRCGLGLSKKTKELVFVYSLTPINFSQLAMIFSQVLECSTALHLCSGRIGVHLPFEPVTPASSGESGTYIMIKE